MNNARSRANPGRSLLVFLALAAGPALAQSTLPVEPVPLNIADMASGSYAFRFEYREKPNPAIWPESKTLTPLNDAWMLTYTSIGGESAQYIPAGDKMVFKEGVIVGDGVTPTRGTADLKLFQMARKWTGGFDSGELDGFLGLGVISSNVVVDGGSKGRVDMDRDALGLTLGFGLSGTVGAQVGLEGRIGVFLNDPFFIFTGSSFAGGFSSDAAFGELAVVWPRNGSVGLRVGVQGVRYVPQREDYESLIDINLWGPFLGLWVALK